jgi:tetratricopeptide (TPR) repeat protein
MRHTFGGTARALVVAALFLLTCLISPAAAQSGSSEETTFFKEYPLALVYRGVALYAGKDYEGAIAAWQGYLAASNESDSAGVNELIREAWVHAYPLSLVYDSYARHEAGDIVGAIVSLERYIELASAGEDTAAVRQTIVKVLIPEQEMAKISVGVTKQR